MAPCNDDKEFGPISNVSTDINLKPDCTALMSIQKYVYSTRTEEYSTVTCYRMATTVTG